MPAARATTYTYRGGQRVALKKRPNQFVLRRLPDDVPEDIRDETEDLEQMSSSSVRATCEREELERLMALGREVAPTHHAYEYRDSGDEFLITDRIIVELREAADEETLGEFAGRYALEIVEKYSDREYLFRLTDETGMNPVKLVVRLVEKDDLVENAEHDLNQRFARCIDLPADPSYQDQWHLHQRTPEFADYDARSSARCEAAWQLIEGFGNHDVVIGVTDDGCQLDHPDFDSHGKFAGWGYFQGTTLVRRGGPGADPRGMYQDGENHGTACAGVIAAETDAELTVGAAPGCRLLPIKWQVTPEGGLAIGDSKMMTMLGYVADRVDVLSNSWGITPRSSWSLTVRRRIRQLAQDGGRRGRGILFLWAAGNENCPIAHQADVDVPYSDGWQFFSGSWHWVGVDTARIFSNDLVDVPGVLHVAALASTARRSHYSNYGTGIELCAPSSNLHKYHRLSLRGLSITTTEGVDAVTGSFGGTSSATPLVAGIAGLVISANPELSAFETASILRQTAAKNLDPSGYPPTPAAVYDPNPIWDVSPIAPFDSGAFQNNGHEDGTWSPWFGHGRVDAAGAVARAFELAEGRSSRVRVERVADLAIPDADPAGVVSRVFVPDHGRIQNLAVSVRITHTYIGDLIVRLLSPDGQAVDLHRREGGRQDNLVRRYDTVTTPALAWLHGARLRGVWMLEVSDRAALDEGHLLRWTLEAELLADGALRRESTPALTIPDADPNGISDVIHIVDARPVRGLEVEVDVTHSWIGDLRLLLTGPNGEKALLHDRTGGRADSIERTYTPDDTPELATFIGAAASGSWVLSVSDHAGQDVGKLNRWGIAII